MKPTNFIRYADKTIAVRGEKGLCLPCHFDEKKQYWRTLPTDHLEWREHLQFPVWIWEGEVPKLVQETRENDYFKWYWDWREYDGFKIWFQHREVLRQRNCYDHYEVPWMTAEMARMAPDKLPDNHSAAYREQREKARAVAAQKRELRKARQHAIP